MNWKPENPWLLSDWVNVVVFKEAVNATLLQVAKNLRKHTVPVSESTLEGAWYRDNQIAAELEKAAKEE